MRCSDFLEGYSDFRDRRVNDLGVMRGMRQHMDSCPRCARYHHVLNRGIGALRDIGVDPTHQFRYRLRHRLAEAVARPAPLFAVPLRLGSVVVAAAVVLLFAGGWRDQVDPAPVVPAPALPRVAASPTPPFVTLADLAAPSPFATGDYYQIRADWDVVDSQVTFVADLDAPR